MSSFTNTEQVHMLTTESALKMIRNAPVGSTFAMHCRVTVPIEGDDDSVFPGHCAVDLTRKAALKICADLIKGFEHRGGRIKLNVRSSQYLNEKPRVTYWIG